MSFDPSKCPSCSFVSSQPPFAQPPDEPIPFRVNDRPEAPPHSPTLKLGKVPVVAPFRVKVVAPQSSENLVLAVERIFQPTALRINHAAAHHLLVEDVRAGKALLLSSSAGALDGEVFCERRRGRLVLDLDWRILGPGTCVQVLVRNVSFSPVDVRAYLAGETDPLL